MDSPRLTGILAAIEQVAKGAVKPVPLHQPSFCGNEWQYVKECLDTGWVSSVGQYVDRFEGMLAEYCGAKRAIAVVNGTAALQVCLELAGTTRGDEVLVPALTFVATANAVAYCGAIPHFVDSNEASLGVDPRKLADYLAEIAEVRVDGAFNRQTGARIRALVPMHTFGHPVDLDPLLELAARYKFELIEDAAESLGSYYKGRHTGAIGRLGALSFNGNKVITTGGGGAILTNDEELGRRAKHLTTTARTVQRWQFSHDEVGYNYRMPNINAALGCAQLEQLDGFLAGKRRLADRYAEAFKGIEGVHLFREPAYANSNYWLNAILLDARFSAERDTVLQMTNDSGYSTRPAWTLMSALPMFAAHPRMPLSAAESIEARLVNLPSSASLGTAHG
jgi:perosamine synthetase